MDLFWSKILLICLAHYLWVISLRPIMRNFMKNFPLNGVLGRKLDFVNSNNLTLFQWFVLIERNISTNNKFVAYSIPNAVLFDIKQLTKKNTFGCLSIELNTHFLENMCISITSKLSKIIIISIMFMSYFKRSLLTCCTTRRHVYQIRCSIDDFIPKNLWYTSMTQYIPWSIQ